MKPRHLCIGDRRPVIPGQPVPEVFQLEAERFQDPQIAIEKHYSPAQLAKQLNISDTKARRMFQNETGVLKIGDTSRRLGRKLKRRYYTLRIPESVALRVIARMRNR